MEVMSYYAELYPVDCPIDRYGAVAKKCCQSSAEKDAMKNDLARSLGKFRGTEREEKYIMSTVDHFSEAFDRQLGGDISPPTHLF